MAEQRLLLALAATKLPLVEPSVAALDGATPQRLVASLPSAVALLWTSQWESSLEHQAGTGWFWALMAMTRPLMSSSASLMEWASPLISWPRSQRGV